MNACDVVPEEERPDLTEFDEDTARWKAQGKRVPWSERKDLFKKHFPESAARYQDAYRWMQDPSIVIRIWEDCIRHGQPSSAGAAGGRRPNDITDFAREELQRLAGLQYTEEPFQVALRVLMKARRQSISMATAAIKAHDPAKIGLSRSRVYRLLLDGTTPTLDEMRLIAATYGKQPEYFVEYRIEAIVGMLGAALEKAAPETSINIFRKLMAK